MRTPASETHTTSVGPKRANHTPPNLEFPCLHVHRRTAHDSDQQRRHLPLHERHHRQPHPVVHQLRRHQRHREVRPYGANTETNVSGGSGAAQNPFLFHYGIQDRVTGTVKYGARWYDPTTGAWTQQDSLNAPLDPGNANRYVYVAGDPVNVQDPTGTCYYDWDSWDPYYDCSLAGQYPEETEDCVDYGGAGFLLGGWYGAAIGCGASLIDDIFS